MKVALFTDLFGEKDGNRCSRHVDEVLGSQFQLQSPYPGTNEYEWKIHAGFMYVGGERFLHADGRTTPTDVTGERKEFLHRDKVALLVARDLSC